MKLLDTLPRSLTLTAALLLLSSCTHSSIHNSQQTTFFNALKLLCGQRFEGEMTFPSEGQDSFAGKKLVAQLDRCSENQVRIPFSVGEDKSRTWLISKLDSGLELKHDHRHKDGTPDDINLYGGITQSKGSNLSQSFFADAHTIAIIPEASTNVWTISLSADNNELTYHLERHQKSRFTAVLKRIGN